MTTHTGCEHCCEARADHGKENYWIKSGLAHQAVEVFFETEKRRHCRPDRSLAEKLSESVLTIAQKLYSYIIIFRIVLRDQVSGLSHCEKLRAM